MRKYLWLCISVLLLSACTSLNVDNDEPLKGEKEVIEMIKERISYQENGENVVVMFKRDGKTDKKITIRANGNLLTEKFIQQEIAYEILQLSSAEEAKEFLAEEIDAFQQVDGVEYSIEFFKPYFVEEIRVVYDELQMEEYLSLKGMEVTKAEKEGDFLYVVREYVEKGYKFID